MAVFLLKTARGFRLRPAGLHAASSATCPARPAPASPIGSSELFNRGHHGRLRRRAASLLPDEPEHTRADGRVPGKDVRSSLVFPDGRRSRGRAPSPTRPPAIFRERCPSPFPIPSAVTPVRRALVSVHDKTGIAELGRALSERGVQLVSTGGTAATLKAAGVEVSLVEEKTGFPEILGGRVKTLHPKIFGGRAGRRDPRGPRAGPRRRPRSSPSTS